ncbi:MAG TPA: hypothetical protein VGK97_09165 [Spongiibacteraceae bacterium]
MTNKNRFINTPLCHVSLIDSSVFKIFYRALAAAFALLALSACGGGGGLAGDNQANDPGTVEYPIAYIQRPAPVIPIPQNEQNNLQDPFAFNPGAKLLIRSRADSNAPETNITDALFPGAEDLYDVKDLAVSPDGKNLVFALHAPMIENADPIDQPSWDIWIYNFATKQIQPVISSKNKSEGSDVAPHFLADGRIVFVSDRQLKSKEQLASSGSPGYAGLTEPSGGPRPKAGVLHRMNVDGSNIDQISFNQSHDLSPAQLRNGKLVFSRWDNMNGGNRMNLYTINPSGMNLSYLYGYNSHFTGNNAMTRVQFSQPREMEDGRIVTVLRASQAENMGGDLVAIDVDHFSDNDQPTWENPTQTGAAQKSLAANPVHTDGTLSPGGEFGAVWPLFDGTGRLLISWSQCRYLDTDNITILPCTATTVPTANAAPLLYGIWIFDPKAQTQKPIVTPKEGVIYTDIVAASPAKTIANAEDNSAANSKNDAEKNDLFDYGNNIATILETGGMAVLDIRSVYNLDGGVGNFGAAVPANMIANQANPANPAYQARRARFLQIIQGVPLPDPDDKIPAANNQILRVQNFAFGEGGNFLRHIIGYVPIEADGSVAVQVPADVPITFNILDANAQKINQRSHGVWLQFRAGEVLHCTGCHDADSMTDAKLTHGRFDSAAPDANIGTNGSLLFTGVSASDVNFPGTRAGQSIAEVYAVNKQKPRLPSLNVYFSDEWAANAGQQNPTLDYRYITADPARPRQVPVTPVTSESCLENALTPQVARWNSSCRIVINYLEHIQPIWDKSRPQFDSLGNPLLDGNNQQIDYRCTSCHSPTSTAGLAQVPAGQLDLSSTASDRDNTRVLSFSELFTADTQQALMGAAVVDVPPDIINNPDGTVTTVEHTVAPVMSAGSARGSARFFGCFAGGVCGNSGGTGTDHSGMLTKGELRLLSEWLDIGAQYYNDVSKAAAAQ